MYRVCGWALGQCDDCLTCCTACMCAAIVRELDALLLVVEQWPGRRDACLMQAATAAPAATPHTDRSRAAAAAVSAHAAATLAWLADHHNMEARVLEQVASLRPRVTAATGSGIFAGQAHCAMARCDVLPRHLLAQCVLWATQSSTVQRLVTCHSSAPQIVGSLFRAAHGTQLAVHCCCRHLSHPWAAAGPAAKRRACNSRRVQGCPGSISGAHCSPAADADGCSSLSG